MTDTIVTLHDHQWKLIRPPGSFVTVYDTVRTLGHDYPTVTQVTCSCGHEHRMVPGSKHRQRDGSSLQWPRLPDTIVRRFHGEDVPCDTCGEMHPDYATQYWACTLCGADLGDIPMAGTGQFEFEVEAGRQATTPMVLELQPGGPGTVTVGMGLPHLFLDGEDLGPVMPGDTLIESGRPVTMDVTPLREEQVTRLTPQESR